MGREDLVTLLVAALSGGTLGAVVREIVAGLVKLREGVRARERDVKNDREEVLANAHAKADAAMADAAACREETARARTLAAETVAVMDRRLDVETRNRRAVEAWAARVELLAIGAGVGDSIPARPQLLAAE